MAFATATPEDSEILLVVFVTDKAGNESEVGEVTISLEDDVLAKNKDLALTALPIKDKSNNSSGELTCAVTALALLNALGGAGGGGGASGPAASVSLEIKELSLKSPPAARGGMQVRTRPPMGP